MKFRPLTLRKSLRRDLERRYTTVELPDGNVRPISDEETMDQKLPEGSGLLLGGPLTSDGATSSPQLLTFQGHDYLPKANQHWKTSIGGLERLVRADRIFPTRSFLNYKLYFSDFPAAPCRIFGQTRWSLRNGTKSTLYRQPQGLLSDVSDEHRPRRFGA